MASISKYRSMYAEDKRWLKERKDNIVNSNSEQNMTKEYAILNMYNSLNELGILVLKEEAKNGCS